MKPTSMASVLMAALALVAALAIGLTSSAAAGTLAHASKHKHKKAKPKARSCKALISGSSLIHDVAVDTGTAPDVDPVVEDNPHYDKRGPFKGITLRRCEMFWTGPNYYGNASAYGEAYSGTPFTWYAGTAVTTRQFTRTYRGRVRQRWTHALDRAPVCEAAHQVARPRQPCVHHDDRSGASVSNPKYQTSYCLYVLSKGKHGKAGNVAILCAWPLSLDRHKQIVKGLLSHHRF